jgi:hypothetical protein
MLFYAESLCKYVNKKVFSSSTRSRKARPTRRGDADVRNPSVDVGDLQKISSASENL